MEVIVRSERRRAWTAEQESEIVAESLGTGLTAAEVARKHGISTGQLYTWRRQLLSGPMAVITRAEPRFRAAGAGAGWRRRRTTALPQVTGRKLISSSGWTRLSCRRFAANVVQLQLHALAYNLANFLRTLALPDEVKAVVDEFTLRERLVKIGARIVRHGRSITFQMAEVMVPRGLFQSILAAIAALRPLPPERC